MGRKVVCLRQSTYVVTSLGRADVVMQQVNDPSLSYTVKTVTCGMGMLAERGEGVPDFVIWQDSRVMAVLTMDENLTPQIIRLPHPKL